MFGFQSFKQDFNRFQTSLGSNNDWISGIQRRNVCFTIAVVASLGPPRGRERRASAATPAPPVLADGSGRPSFTMEDQNKTREVQVGPGRLGKHIPLAKSQ